MQGRDIPGGGRPLLWQGGPSSYQPRPSAPFPQSHPFCVPPHQPLALCRDQCRPHMGRTKGSWVGHRPGRARLGMGVGAIGAFGSIHTSRVECRKSPPRVIRSTGFGIRGWKCFLHGRVRERTRESERARERARARTAGVPHLKEHAPRTLP